MQPDPQTASLLPAVLPAGLLQRTRLLTSKRRGRIALAVLLGWIPLIAIAQATSDTPASLIGRSVETLGGEELGKVRDFAIDLESGRVRYVVVAIGSFMVDDSLIAIAPQALKISADGPLVLQTDRSRLTGAQRFAAGRWPAEAGVMGPSAGEDDEAAGRAAGRAAVAGTEVEADRGSATISDGNRTATLSGGEQHIQFAEPPPGSTAAGDATTAANGPAGAIDARGPLSRFDRLDRNGDGLLDRAEIAHELTRDDRFLDIDLDGSGGVDPGEFDRMHSGRGDG